jgi:hypothetical protein
MVSVLLRRGDCHRRLDALQPAIPAAHGIAFVGAGNDGIFCAVCTLSIYFTVNRTSAKNVSQYHYTQLLVGAQVPTWSGTTSRVCPCWPLDR